MEKQDGVVIAPDPQPAVGRISLNADEVREWAHQARGTYQVPVGVYERALNVAGVQTSVWVAVLWPKR
jgi:hypothetical protein